MQAVVITTINAPTDAIKAWATWAKAQPIETRLFVVGDKKTPKDWKLEGVEFLPFKWPTNGYALSDDLPVDHYARKNLGYLAAIKAGADVLIDTDDDNFPYPNWKPPAFEGRYDVVLNDGWTNMYRAFGHPELWPRGFPLNLVQSERARHRQVMAEVNAKVGVWQGLADGEPDVDAIYRMLMPQRESTFIARDLLLPLRGLCPFNSQATVFRKEVFPLLYLPTSVSMRFCDILRGLVAQPILWKFDYHVGFTSPAVRQVRNPHDLRADMVSELQMYKWAEQVPEWVETGNFAGTKTMGDALLVAYGNLRGAVVDGDEQARVEKWLEEVGA